MNEIKQASKRIHERIGSYGDYTRAMKLMNKSLQEVKAMKFIDVFEAISIDNAMNG